MEARVETRRAGGGAGRDEGARTHACELGIGGRIRWQHTGAQGSEVHEAGYVRGSRMTGGDAESDSTCCCGRLRSG